jgi:hypothetical protein
MITDKSWEEMYGGKVRCLVEVRWRGELIQELWMKQCDAVPTAAALEYDAGFQVSVRRFGEIIYGRDGR